MSSEILERPVEWLEEATEAELRKVVAALDECPGHPRAEIVWRAFDKECARRAGRYYESKCGGEWI